MNGSLGLVRANSLFRNNSCAAGAHNPNEIESGNARSVATKREGWQIVSDAHFPALLCNLMAANHLLDAVFDDEDEVTAKHSPDLALLKKAGSRYDSSPISSTTGDSRARSRNGRSREGDSGVSFIGRPPPPPPRARLEVLPLESLRELRDLFAEYIGPAARPLLLQAIASQGATPEAFPAILRIELIASLARHFDEPRSSAEFVERAKRILGAE